jgi:hypothetical protein
VRSYHQLKRIALKARKFLRRGFLEIFNYWLTPRKPTQWNLLHVYLHHFLSLRRGGDRNLLILRTLNNFNPTNVTQFYPSFSFAIFVFARHGVTQKYQGLPGTLKHLLTGIWPFPLVAGKAVCWPFSKCSIRWNENWNRSFFPCLFSISLRCAAHSKWVPYRRKSHVKTEHRFMWRGRVKTLCIASPLQHGLP